MPFYLSQAGGGGGIHYSLDDYPVKPVTDNGLIYQQNDWYTYNQTFYNQFSSSPGNGNDMVYAQVGSGWTTILNETGSGFFYWVFSPTTNGGGTTGFRVTIDGTLKEWTRLIPQRGRLLGGSATGAYPSSNTANSVYMDAWFPDQIYNLSSGQGNMQSSNRSHALGGSGSGYLAHNIPGIQYDSSLKVEVYTNNLYNSTYYNYAACLRLKY